MKLFSMRAGKLIAYTKIWITMIIIASVFLCFSSSENVSLTKQKSYSFTMSDHDVQLLAVSQIDSNQPWGWVGGWWGWWWGWWWGGGWWGWISNSDVWWTGSVDEWNNNSWNVHWSAWDLWDEEVVSAYNRARKYNVTTMNTIELADPDWYVIRWHMAKMMTNFVLNVMWKTLPNEIPSVCQNWNDPEYVRESEEIKDYATKSCALWIMWIDMKNNEFLPNDIVSRAEFWTIISRLLWWDKYNVKHTSEHPYYEYHLNMLKAKNIMTKIENPLERKELRKRVRVVLKRIWGNK